MAFSKIVMIQGTEYRYEPDGTRTLVATFYGKSTDQKPTVGVNNADRFYEMDTKKVFLFDEDDSTWLEQ